jgi:hypothetical protein
MLKGQRTLRDVEAESSFAASSRRVPDTTLYELCRRLEPEGLRERLHAQIRSLYRAKSLVPGGLPCGVLAIDGKGIGTLEHDAEGSAQKGRRTHGGSPYWLSRVLRASLVSTPSRPCVDQSLVPVETNEMGAFENFFSGLLAAYGSIHLFEVVTADAGITSKHNADLVNGSDKAYLFALKNTQPELLAEAQRLLLPRVEGEPEAETKERAQGNLVGRRLYRTTEIATYHGWNHLRQAWLVVQQTLSPNGKLTVEHRFFVTNLRPGLLTAAQALLLVRSHWGIENNCFWSIDTQWWEDDTPWCTQGRAIEMLGLLRLMAYNLLSLARKRHLCQHRADGTRTDAPPWRLLFEWIRFATRLEAAGLGPRAPPP